MACTIMAYMNQSLRDDWQTLRSLFDPLHAEFQFTVDAAANEINALLPRFWSLEDDALTKDWTGERIWCNPPYGSHQIPFIRKAAMLEADVSVLLIPSRTDTRIWHEAIFEKAEIRFLRGRVKFTGAKAAAPFPSAICIWRKEY